MGDDKDKSHNHASILNSSGLIGKAITSLDAFVQGSNYILLIGYSGGSTYLKWRQGMFEIGGTQDFGTGTQTKF